MMDGLVMGAGTFRNTGVGVYAGDQLIHAGTPAQYVPEAMQQLFEWLQNTTAHPLVASCVFHYEFEFIHPFADGNGRTGRLWQTLILRKWEPIFTYLPIESMILEHQADYYAALNAANTQGSATVFIEFMLEMILEALKNVYVKQHIKSPEDQLLVLLKSDPRMTIPVMAEHLGLSDRQIRRLIASLKAQNRLHREGSNKTGRWVVSKKSR
jgi:Fic family protein